MARFLLIRHAQTDAVGQTIAGRAAGTSLNEQGRGQIDGLLELLRGERLDRICSSPLERTRETAQAIAGRFGLEAETRDALLEIDFGDWTGRTFEELRPDPEWRQFNTFRSGTRIPGGELMLEAQTRVVGLMLELQASSPHQTIALVSHGDTIKAAVCYWLGIPIDFMLRFEIGPASVTAVELSEYGPRVLYVNRFAGNSE